MQQPEDLVFHAHSSPRRSSPRVAGTSCSRRIWLAGVGAFAATAAVSEVARAGQVVGRITNFKELVNPVWQEARDPEAHGYWFREPSPTVRAEHRRPFPLISKELQVVAIATAQQPKLPKQELLVGGGRTNPVTKVVAPGTELSFRNTDPFKHRIYGVGVSSFAAADMGPNSKRVWSAPKPGTYEIRDELTPSLRTWIVSDARVAAATAPNLKGVYALNIETPGEYLLKVYFAGKVVGESRAFVLSGSKSRVDLSRTPIQVKATTKKGAK